MNVHTEFTIIDIEHVECILFIFFQQIQGYPVVVISHDHHKSLSGRENAKSAFLPHDETVWKRAMHAW